MPTTMSLQIHFVSVLPISTFWLIYEYYIIIGLARVSVVYKQKKAHNYFGKYMIRM